MRTLGLLIATFLFAFGLAVVLEGCGPKIPAREAARSAVEVTAAAVKVLDEACARAALLGNDLELAKRCETAYDAARRHILATASGIDSWERFESSRASVTCAAAAAAGDLQAIVELLVARRVEVPPIAADARLLVAALGGCPEAGL